MRTLFVNPSTPKRRRPVKRRSKPVTRRTTRKRARRRNAGHGVVSPFVASLNHARANPTRRKRRNPRRFTRTNMYKSFMNIATMFLGTGVGASANLFAINNIENIWARNSLRILSSSVASGFLKGTFGASVSSAFLYPSFVELAMHLNILPGMDEAPAPQEADLRPHLLEADLRSQLFNAKRRVGRRTTSYNF